MTTILREELARLRKDRQTVMALLNMSRVAVHERIAVAVRTAMKEYHEDTGDYVVGIDVDMIRHSSDGEVNAVLLTNVAVHFLE